MLSCEISFVLIIFTLLVSGEWNTKDYQKREHSLTKPYQGSSVNMPLWDFIGSTIVTNKFVRLTSDHQSKQGAVWNSVPVTIRNWEMHVHFKIHGSGKDLFGDGIAIWYTRDRMELGSVFGSRNHFSGLGIFLDTYSNHNGPHHHSHPYVSAMVSNGSYEYDHDSDGTHTQLAGCESQFRNVPYDTHITIRYEENVLKVSLDAEGKNGWQECFQMPGVKLPLGYYLGISSATGDLADNHDVISIKFYDLGAANPLDITDYYNIDPSAQYAEAPRERIEDESSGSSGHTVLIVVCVIVLVGIVGGVAYYFLGGGSGSYSNRKRLY